jgi:hypothetical protein
MNGQRFNGVKISSAIGRIVTGSAKGETLEARLDEILGKSSKKVKTAQVKGKFKNPDGTLSSGQLEVEKTLVNDPKVIDEKKGTKEKTVKKVTVEEEASSGQTDLEKNVQNKPEAEKEVKKASYYIPFRDLAVLAGKKPADAKTLKTTLKLLKKMANLSDKNYTFLYDYFSLYYPKEYVEMLVLDK